MDERNIKITAVVAAVIAVIAVGYLIISTYATGDDTATVLEEPDPVDGPRAPADPVPGDDEEVPEAGAGHDDGPIDEQDAPELREELIAITLDFFDEWLQPGDVEERQEAVTPYATPGFVDLMELTDPNPLPEGPISDEPEVVALAHYAGATRVELEGGVHYRVNIVLEPEGWRVNELIADPESPAFVKDNPPEEPPSPDSNDTTDDEPPDSGGDGGS